VSVHIDARGEAVLPLSPPPRPAAPLLDGRSVGLLQSRRSILGYWGFGASGEFAGKYTLRINELEWIGRVSRPLRQYPRKANSGSPFLLPAL